MARKKHLDETEEQQENLTLKGLHNKKNLLGSSQQRGNVLGLLHHARTDHKFHNSSTEESYQSLILQLSTHGLTVREMTADGNCLFRALSDQLEGNTRNHLLHRRAVVQYIRDHRGDFEPFIEDNQQFDNYVQNLSQPGTFAGNDAIVAFARLHNVTVVIHQLNSPEWLIHPNCDDQKGSPSGQEVHIAYQNDHYNSVRQMGDDPRELMEPLFHFSHTPENALPFDQALLALNTDPFNSVGLKEFYECDWEDEYGVGRRERRWHVDRKRYEGKDFTKPRSDVRGNLSPRSSASNFCEKNRGQNLIEIKPVENVDLLPLNTLPNSIPVESPAQDVYKDKLTKEKMNFGEISDGRKEDLEDKSVPCGGGNERSHLPSASELKSNCFNEGVQPLSAVTDVDTGDRNGGYSPRAAETSDINKLSDGTISEEPELNQSNVECK